MRTFKIVYFDCNDNKKTKRFNALDSADAIGQAFRWLRYGTTFQLDHVEVFVTKTWLDKDGVKWTI